MTAQMSLLGDETPAQTAKAQHGLASTDLVAFAPCGCWMAVMVESTDFAENAKRTAEFVRDTERGGGGLLERMAHADFCAVMNGSGGDLRSGCDHDPQWGGLVATHRFCPACDKDVKVKKDGSLAAHKPSGRTWGDNCSQEPRPSRASA